MTTATTPTTELEAVNLMLSVIGESPLSTLSGTTVVYAELAQQILSEASRSVQVKGYHFNTEVDYPLLPDATTKFINVPLNALRVDSTGADIGIDVVHRGTRLYDRSNHTYEFDKSLKVEMVVLLPFEEVPEPARHYISVKAARIFQARTVGSDALYQFTAADEREALVAFKNAEGNTANHNILTGSYSVARILQRK